MSIIHISIVEFNLIVLYLWGYILRSRDAWPAKVTELERGNLGLWIQICLMLKPMPFINILDWIVSPKIHVDLEHQNVSLLGNKVFAVVIKVRIKMKSYWIRVGPKSNESVHLRGRKEHQRYMEKKAMWRWKQRLEPPETVIGK